MIAKYSVMVHDETTKNDRMKIIEMRKIHDIKKGGAFAPPFRISVETGHLSA